MSSKQAGYQKAYRDRQRGGEPRQPVPCGTYGAAAKHLRRKEECPTGKCSVEGNLVSEYQAIRYWVKRCGDPADLKGRPGVVEFKKALALEQAALRDGSWTQGMKAARPPAPTPKSKSK